MSTVNLKKTTLRSESDERNKIQKIEEHFRNHWALPLCNQPILLATLSAPTEMLLGQTTVKPFAISDFDSPTFFKGEIKTRMCPLFKAKKEAVAFVGRRWNLPMVDSDGRTTWWSEGAAAEDGSGGGFKETAVMLRRQLEEEGFSTMRECVWARFSGDTRALPIRRWVIFTFIFCIGLLLKARSFSKQWEYTVSWWTFGEWQVEAEEHGLVFCWDWLSGSRWRPGSFYPRRPSWRKLGINGKQTLPAVAWTGETTETNTAEYNGHRKITVHRRPRNLARGPTISYSLVSWLPRNTWTAGPWRHIGKWCVREECCFPFAVTHACFCLLGR